MRARSLGPWFLCAALAQSPPAPPAGAEGDPPGAGGKPEAPPGSPKRKKAGRPEGAARSVKLPESGERGIAEILALAGKLFGRPVVTHGPKVEEVRVVISSEMARREVRKEEMKLLLGAHGVYLFPHQDRKGPVLVATCDPGWTPESPPPRFLKSFQIRGKDFEGIAKEVERYLAERNQKKPPGEPPAGAARDPRTKRIIVRAFSENVIAGVAEIIARRDRLDPQAPHLYTYAPKHRPAEVLLEEVLESLGKAEGERLSLVVSRRGNLLLIRASEELYRKVEAILQARDVPEK